MNLVGEKVKHKKFGVGEIESTKDNYIVVKFDNSIKVMEFEFRTAFGKFLTLENESLAETLELKLKKLNTEKDESDRVQKELQKIEAAKRKKEYDLRMKLKKSVRADGTSKVNDHDGNVAFKCNYCNGGKEPNLVGFNGVCSDGVIQYNTKVAKRKTCIGAGSKCFAYINEEITREELDNYYNENGSVCDESVMLKDWDGFTGITQKSEGDNKPVIIKNAKPNALAMLTTRLPKTTDSERFIFAVYLMGEHFEGDNVKDGFVESHPKFKLKLTVEETNKIKFWNYYFNQNKPERMVLGSGIHRYLTDIQSAQVLRDILEAKKGKEDEALAKEFFDYFCQIKVLKPEDLVEPQGALQKVNA